jgi:hypothetical protein
LHSFSYAAFTNVADLLYNRRTRRNFFWTSRFTKRKVYSSRMNSVVKLQPNTCRRHSGVMRVSDIIRLSIVAVLSAYLYIRLWRRARAPLPETHWTGHGIDITPVSERVQRARSDFASELQSRPPDTCQRRGLLVRARRAVGQLAYFRRRNAQSSSHTEDDTGTHVF